MPDLESQWQKLLDAKLQLDMAWSYLREVREDMLTGAVPAPDSNYAYLRALDGEEAAIDAYVKALGEFRAAALPDRHARGGG